MRSPGQEQFAAPVKAFKYFRGFVHTVTDAVLYCNSRPSRVSLSIMCHCPIISTVNFISWSESNLQYLMLIHNECWLGFLLK